MVGGVFRQASLSVHGRKKKFCLQRHRMDLVGQWGCSTFFFRGDCLSVKKRRFSQIYGKLPEKRTPETCKWHKEVEKINRRMLSVPLDFNKCKGCEDKDNCFPNLLNRLHRRIDALECLHKRELEDQGKIYP